MSLDFYDRLPSAAAWWWWVTLVASLALVAYEFSTLFQDCRCPPGSRGHLVQGLIGFECICEPARGTR